MCGVYCEFAFFFVLTLSFLYTRAAITVGIKSSLYLIINNVDLVFSRHNMRLLVDKTLV